MLPKTLVHSICCLVLAVSGCAQRASFTQLKPARIDTPIRRLALLDVTGPESVRDAAQQTLATGLARSGAFELVGERDLLAAAPSRLRFQNGKLNMPSVVEAARRVGAEGILVSRLRIVNIGDTTFGTVTMRMGDPEVAAAIHYRLIAARTGFVVEQDTVRSESYKGELERVASGPTSQSLVFQRLAKESASLVAASLAPHKVPVEIELASQVWGTGATQLRGGNRAAQEGDWSEAMEQWKGAIRADQGNDSAWYNLGVAFEATGDFSRARDAYQYAARLRQDELYQDAIARLNVTTAEFRVATAQSARSKSLRHRQPTGRSQPPFRAFQREGEISTAQAQGSTTRGQENRW